jgi:hypothetical protein
MILFRPSRLCRLSQWHQAFSLLNRPTSLLARAAASLTMAYGPYIVGIKACLYSAYLEISLMPSWFELHSTRQQEFVLALRGLSPYVFVVRKPSALAEQKKQD